MTLRAPLILALLLPLAACAKPMSNLPSLAIRDAERVTGQLQPVTPDYVAPPLPGAVLSTIDALVKDADAANARFSAAAPASRRAVAAASGTSAGNDNWARAQVALANLEAERSTAMVALAELDRLYIEAALDNADLVRIETARQAIATQVNAQSATIDQLAAGMSR